MIINLVGAGSIIGGSSNTPAITNGSTGFIEIHGNINILAGTSGYGILNTSAGFINLYGNIVGGNTSISGIYNQGTGGTVNVFGNVTAGSNASAYGISNFGSGVITIYGGLIATTTTPAINQSLPIVATVLNNSGNYLWYMQNFMNSNNVEVKVISNGICSIIGSDPRNYITFNSAIFPIQLSANLIQYGIYNGDRMGTLAKGRGGASIGLNTGSALGSF